MIMDQLLACEQLRYKKPISITNQYLDFVMQLRPQSKIKVTPVWPRGWEAEVVAEDKVWTINCDNGFIHATKVADYIETRPNGALVKGPEEDITEYERHFLEENYYGGLDTFPTTCDIFCNPDEANCIHCPKNFKPG
jgi:hypothetical protein